MIFRTSYSVKPGENIAVWSPSFPGAHRRLIVAGHPATGSVSGAYGRDANGPANLFDRLAQAGYTVIYPRMGGDLWGNASARTLISTAITWSTTAWQADIASGVGLIGISMGNVSVCNWALANLGTASKIVSFIPASDLNDVHANNRLSQTAAVNAAYGGTYVEGTHGPTANPTNYAASLATPLRLYYSSNDTAVPSATVTGLAAAVPDGEATSVGAHAHNFTAIHAVDPAAIIAEFDEVA